MRPKIVPGGFMGTLAEMGTGVVLFEEGDIDDRFFIIKEGQIRITRVLEDTTQEIAILTQGDYLGEMSILTHEPRSGTATTITPLKILIYDESNFRELFTEEPQALDSILRQFRIKKDWFSLSQQTAFANPFLPPKANFLILRSFLTAHCVPSDSFEFLPPMA